MMQKCEDSGMSIPVEQKRDKNVFLEAPNGGMGMTPLEEGFSGTKSDTVVTPDLSREKSSRFPTSKTREGRCLEMPVFEGWNLEGWIFRVE